MMVALPEVLGAVGDEAAGADASHTPSLVFRQAASIQIGQCLGLTHCSTRFLPPGAGGHLPWCKISLPAYSASKAATDSITQHVVTAYGKRGIRCNAVAPALVLSP